MRDEHRIAGDSHRAQFVDQAMTLKKFGLGLLLERLIKVQFKKAR
jgi:hypothetical protein